MNKNIVKLIKDALIHMGCPLSVMSNVDANSPIVFSFNNGVVMNLSVVDEAVLLWSPIDDYSPKYISQNGAKFLELMMQSSPYFVAGKMHLSNENGKIILHGLVKEASLEKAAYFASTLQTFFDMAAQLRQVSRE